MRDIVIIGAGPAGMTAAMYAKRAERDVLLLGRPDIASQITLSELVENWPGVRSISGLELIEQFKDQIVALDVETESRQITNISKQDSFFTLSSPDGDIETRSVIVGTGAYPRKLGIPGEDEFVGRGVSYCATCDGPFFRDLEVAVIGGGDTAIKEALYLSKICKKIHVIHRRDCLRAEKINQRRIFDANNVEFHWDAVAKKIEGQMGVDSVTVENIRTNEESLINVQGVFIFVGILPSTDFIDVEKDKDGFIKTNQEMKTSVSGVFAAGDCRSKRLRQVVTAVGDGATAAVAAEDYLDSLGK